MRLLVNGQLEPQMHPFFMTPDFRGAFGCLVLRLCCVSRNRQSRRDDCSFALA